MGKDKLFVLLTIVLILLFAASVVENIFSSSIFSSSIMWKGKQSERVDKILTGLEEAGLEPKEAKYYRVVNE